MCLRNCRHSLVTPIDWKRGEAPRDLDFFARRHSLVTPIDWKPQRQGWRAQQQAQPQGRHSLVTPIDWKPTIVLP